MSTVIHFECRNTTHLATRSRGGGGLVMHHGTFGYCDGSASDNDHRWVPTGGVFLEQLDGRLLHRLFAETLDTTFRGTH